jgi:hypothetical protein
MIRHITNAEHAHQELEVTSDPPSASPFQSERFALTIHTESSLYSDQTPPAGADPATQEASVTDTQKRGSHPGVYTSDPAQPSLNCTKQGPEVGLLSRTFRRPCVSVLRS